MRVKAVCNLVFQARYFYFIKIRKTLRSFDSEFGVAGRDHNERAIRHGRPSDRILRLILPLSVIDRMTPESKILSIGCRYETDLLYLAAYGFDPKNIRGLDLFSYSPWVDLGNMHNMPYADDSWDAALLGWVISYSTEPERAAKEVLRVVRPGGLVAIAVTYYPEPALEQFIKDGLRFGTENRIQTVEGMLALFGDHVERVYFRHDVSDPTRQGSCLVIFSIKK
jgi:SAM-dependent methyltransferase